MIKTYPFFIERVQNLKTADRERLILISTSLKALAITANHKAHANDDSAKAYRKRMERVLKANPDKHPSKAKRTGNEAENLHWPIEVSNTLLEKELGFSACGELPPGKATKDKIEKLLKAGEECGLWYYLNQQPNGLIPTKVLILRNWKGEALIPYEPTSASIIKRLQRNIEERKEEIRKLRFLADSSELIAAHAEATETLKAPTLEEWEALSLRMIAGGMRTDPDEDGNSRPYLFDREDQQKHPNLFNTFDLLDARLERKRLPSGQDSLAIAPDGVESWEPNRIYTLFNLTMKELRERCTFGGQRIAMFDGQAFHLNLIASRFEKETGKKAPYFMKGDAHQKIADLLGITRPQAKDIDLAFFNHDPNLEERASDKRMITDTESMRAILIRFREEIRKACPELLEWHQEICRSHHFVNMKDHNRKRLQDHQQFSRYLNAEEVHIMAQVVRLLRNLGITCDTAHDCLAVPEEFADIASMAFNGVLRLNGIPTTAKRDKLASLEWGVDW